MKNEYGAELDKNGYAPTLVQINEEPQCWMCQRSGMCVKLDRHEIFGGAYRDKSKRLGLWCYLCHEEHHIFGRNSVHQNHDVALELKQLAQRRAMLAYGWSEETFIKEFGKSYFNERYNYELR